MYDRTQSPPHEFSRMVPYLCILCRYLQCQCHTVVIKTFIQRYKSSMDTRLQKTVCIFLQVQSIQFCKQSQVGAQLILSVFINLYMFQATMCPSSGETTVFLCDTWYLLFCMDDCLVCQTVIHTEHNLQMCICWFVMYVHNSL